MVEKLLRMVRKTRKNEKGFTLVELMVVVVIIGILTAIAVPVYNNVTKKASENADAANIRILKGAANTAIASLGVPSGGFKWIGDGKDGATNEGAAEEEESEYIWEKWVESPFPEVPEGAVKEGKTVYRVEVDSNGKVTVESVVPSEAQ